jgi:hypothetical protein
VSGRLTTRAGAAIAGAQIEIQVRRSRGRRTVGSAVTGADGSFGARVPAGSNAIVRAVDRGGAGRPAVVSEPVPVAVRPHVELTGSAPVIIPGGSVQLSGAIAPAKRRLTLAVALQGADGVLREIQAVPLTAGADGRFSHTLVLSAPGKYEIVARTAADKKNAVGFSAPVAVIVA